MQIRRLTPLLALLFVFAQQLHAQVKVEMGIGRRLYILYEPIPITVLITNLSGHDLTLSDADSQNWFSFQVTSGDGRIIPPMNLDYKIPPLTIPTGQTVKKTLNLATMYAVQDFGLYRIRASVYSHETRKYTSSASEEFQITDGKLFWQETVGVPQGGAVEGAHRTLSLLTFRQPKYNMLYIRVEDKDAGTVYTTSPLGILINANDPTVKLDKSNQLHVLQLIGSRTYVYSRISLDGDYEQLNYNSVGSRPVLKTDAEGEVYVLGGKLDVPVATPAAGTEGPKVSDRPAGFPAPDQSPQPPPQQ